MPSLKYTKAKWPMALDELIKRRDEEGKGSKKVGRISNVTLFAFLLGQILLVRWLEADGEPASWIPITMIVFLFAFLVGSVGFLIWWSKRSMRAFDLLCPSCGMALDARKLMPLAVATGHCGNCGAFLVANHPSKTEQ